MLYPKAAGWSLSSLRCSLTALAQLVTDTLLLPESSPAVPSARATCTPSQLLLSRKKCVEISQLDC